MSDLVDRTEDRTFRKTGEPPLEHVPFSYLAEEARRLTAENKLFRRLLAIAYGELDGADLADTPLCADIRAVLAK